MEIYGQHFNQKWDHSAGIYALIVDHIDGIYVRIVSVAHGGRIGIGSRFYT